MNPPEIHMGWIEEELSSTSITEAWVETHASLGELWRKLAQEKYINNDVVMVDIGKKEKKDEKVDKTMSTPKKALIFAGEDSILKSPLSRSKSQGSSQIYFRSRSNKKFTMKKDI